jgi:hypothetical protein
MISAPGIEMRDSRAIATFWLQAVAVKALSVEVSTAKLEMAWAGGLQPATRNKTQNSPSRMDHSLMAHKLSRGFWFCARVVLIDLSV